jgi:hypothetical protein
MESVRWFVISLSSLLAMGGEANRAVGRPAPPVALRNPNGGTAMVPQAGFPRGRASR